MRFSVVLDPEEDGSVWNVTVPALPGCIAWGGTVEEALAHACEAVAGHVAALVEAGLPMPVETMARMLTAVDVESPTVQPVPA